MQYVLFVFGKSTFVSYLIQTIYQLQLVIRELMTRCVDEHILEAVVGESTFSLNKTVFSAETCRHGRVQHESLRHSEEKVKCASAVVHTYLSHGHIGRTV